MKSSIVFIVITALIMACTSTVVAQPSWSAAGVPIFTIEMRNIYTDTVGDAIYFCGMSSIDGDFEFSDQGISVYANGQWDTLGVFDNVAECIIRWGDTLVVGGVFLNINGVGIAGCAGLVNGEWVPFGAFCCPETNPYKFRIIDGELYAIGAFQTVDGQLCNGIAKRYGGNWVSVGGMVGEHDNYITDLVRYNGQLVIAGSLRVDSTDNHGVAILNDTVWEPLGSGIAGNLGQGRSLAVYQGDLYVGGAININDGNAGHGIMRWDGQQFHPVGDGFQGINNDYSNHTSVSAMQVRNGLLYCSGLFRYAGHAPAMGLATWNGTDWCGLGGELRLPVGSFDFYHDTLFVGPFHDAEGVNVNCAAKYIGSYPDTCTQQSTAISATTTSQYSILNAQVSDGHIRISLPSTMPPCAIALLDANGRTIASGSGPQVSFATGGLAPGVYLIRAADLPPHRVMVTDP